MKRLILMLIRVYRTVGSPFLGGACRFTPSCSAYAAEAVARHGTVRGTGLALRRLLRCHPFNRHPFFDPVPPYTSPWESPL